MAGVRAPSAPSATAAAAPPMMNRLEARPEAVARGDACCHRCSRRWRRSSSASSLFAALGKDPVAAFHVFFIKPVATRYGVGELLLKASPLMLIATGLAVGYRANVWNIGAEGQLTLGAIAGGGLALALAMRRSRRRCCCPR